METAKTSPITVDDLMKPENAWREVANGQWVDAMTPSYNHGRIGVNIILLLGRFVQEHDLGHVLQDGVHYLLHKEISGLAGARIPDVSFVRKDNIPPDFDQNRPFPGAPDLAVEVVSTCETETKLIEKVRDYLTAGTEEVWVLFPSVEEVHRYRRDEPQHILVYRESDVLESETLLPGLQITVSDFFK